MKITNMTHDYDKGLKIVRAEGINFSTFKATIIPLLKKPVDNDEDQLIQYYNEYAGIRSIMEISIAEFVIQMDINESDKNDFYINPLI